MSEPRSARGRASVPPSEDPWADVAPSSGRARVPSAGSRGPVGRAAVGRAPGGPGGRGPTGPGGGGVGGGARPGKRKPRWGLITLGVVGVLVVALIAGGLGLWSYLSSVDKGVKRQDFFGQVAGDRPAKTVSGAFNILLLGSDSRNPDNIEADARTDTIMVLHVTAAHDKAYLVSLPRDLYIPIAKTADGKSGGGKAKINAAFAWGGTPLMIKTIENYTGVLIDHAAVIDFDGLRAVTDALGGVDMNVEQDTTSIHGNHRFWAKGTHHFSGDAALDYIRQRKQFPDGDFARVRHQQTFLKAMLDKASDSGTLTNPFKLKSFLESLTKAIVVDNDFSMIDMAVQFRNLRSQDLTFLTSPNLGTDMVGDESVVVSDPKKALAFYNAVDKDEVAAWVQANPPQK